MAGGLRIAVDGKWRMIMPLSKTAAYPAAFAFPYITCRNISDKEDEAADRKVYAGKAQASSVLELEDNENVREYLVDAPS